MARVFGTVTDMGLRPLQSPGAKLRFTPSSPAFDGMSLYSAAPVEVSPDTSGFFEADLLATTTLPALVHIDVDVIYRTAAGSVKTERLPWWLDVPEEGGAIGDLLRYPGDAGKVFIGTEPPATASDYQWWLNPETADLYQWEN